VTQQLSQSAAADPASGTMCTALMSQAPSRSIFSANMMRIARGEYPTRPTALLKFC